MFEQIVGMNAYSFGMLPIAERRRIWCELTDEQANAVFDEYMDAQTDMIAPVGSLVKNRYADSICLYGDGTRYVGLAVVIGQKHADHHRRIYMLGKHMDRAGDCVLVGMTDTESIEVVEKTW